MKRRTLFVIKCYAAVLLFVLAAYMITFKHGYFLNEYIAYNLCEESDIYPTVERYVAILLPDRSPTLPVESEGFHRFLMPVDGNIAVNFSEKIDGVILQCQSGSTVIAGDDGNITAVRYNKGVGWYIDIYHGNGIYSRYANLSNIRKKEGLKVKRGDVIAKVDDAFGGRFYFQLFINGKAVNPVTATLMKQGI